MLNEKNPVAIEKLIVRGYRSIKNETIEFNNINILIGCNGAGKSNLLSLLQFISSIQRNRHKIFVSHKGGAQTLLYKGKKETKNIYIQINNPQPDNLENSLSYSLCLDEEDNFFIESGFVPVGKFVFDDVYHVDDTTIGASIKQAHDLVDDIELREDAANLAPYLYSLKKCNIKLYNQYINTIRLVAPFFEDFILEPNNDANNVLLRWKQFDMAGAMNINQLSDGTLRFAALTALLLLRNDSHQSIIIIDEPELGLHPFAVSILCELIKKKAFEKQVIIATQSKDVVDNFDVEDILVVDRDKNGSHFKRLQREPLTEWLEEYSLGELWDKNVLGGRLSQ